MIRSIVSIERRGGEHQPLLETEWSWRTYRGGTFSSDQKDQEKPWGRWDAEAAKRGKARQKKWPRQWF